jgi:hypothetical protein
MNSLPRDKAGVGSAMNDTTRMTGGALGLAVSGSVFAHIYAHRLKDSKALKSLLDNMGAAGTPKAARTQLFDNVSDSIGKALGVADGYAHPSTIKDEATRKAVSAIPHADRMHIANTIIHEARSSFVPGMHGGFIVGLGGTVVAIVIALMWLPKRSLTEDQAAGIAH